MGRGCWFQVSDQFFVFRIVNSVAFHPDGNCIAAGTADHYVKVRREVLEEVAFVFGGEGYPLSLLRTYTNRANSHQLVWAMVSAVVSPHPISWHGPWCQQWCPPTPSVGMGHGVSSGDPPSHQLAWVMVSAVVSPHPISWHGPWCQQWCPPTPSVGMGHGVSSGVPPPHQLAWAMVSAVVSPHPISWHGSWCQQWCPPPHQLAWVMVSAVVSPHPISWHGSWCQQWCSGVSMGQWCQYTALVRTSCRHHSPTRSTVTPPPCFSSGQRDSPPPPPPHMSITTTVEASQLLPTQLPMATPLNSTCLSHQRSRSQQGGDTAISQPSRAGQEVTLTSCIIIIFWTICYSFHNSHKTCIISMCVFLCLLILSH